ncbi:MAG: class I SAM-dependent methyltransferase [Actinomycetota bacterium]|nr:class I SAM-dependent methyltransferase [Actinomycetota bacterium]
MSAKPYSPGYLSKLERLTTINRGFFTYDEGMKLFDEARRSMAEGTAYAIEVGSYCGTSTAFLGLAAKATGGVVVSVDHHFGSEENGPSWESFDKSLFDRERGTVSTLSRFRSMIHSLDLEEYIAPVVSTTSLATKFLRDRADFIFIDGGHGEEVAFNDYFSYVSLVRRGGVLAIHDVFEDPSKGGRPPFEIYTRAVASEQFTYMSNLGSLYFLRRR